MNAYVAHLKPGMFSGLENVFGASETKPTTFEQQDTKPAIDDVICHYLDGDALKNALSFIDHVRAAKMKIKWIAVNVWSVRYRNRRVLDIIVRQDTWRVRLVYDHAISAYLFTKSDKESIRRLVHKLKFSTPETLLETTPATS